MLAFVFLNNFADLISFFADDGEILEALATALGAD